jgi:hypothetical protein
MDLYFGHGEAWAATRTAGGLAGDFDLALPEINSLSLSIERETVEHVSKRTSIASKDLKVSRLMTMSGTLNVSTHTKEMLALYLYGNVAADAGGAFAAEAFDDSTIAVGQIVPAPNDRTHLSSIVITDSTGSPITLTLNTHYEIVDADAGLIHFLDVTTGSLVQPFKIAGTEGAGSSVGILTQRVYEKWLRFKGINIADEDAVVIVDLYRVQFNPASQWQLLNDGSDVNMYEIEFEALVDTTKAVDATLGRHGRYRELT